MDGPKIDDALRQEIEAIAEDSDCRLLHARFKGQTLQVFLDRDDGGVNLDHCQSVSRQVSAFLDIHDFGTGKYVLEVSSPGLDRELFEPQDYQRFQGRLAKVTFFSGPERQKKTLIGRLKEFDPDAAGGGRVTMIDQSSNEEHQIAVDDIKIARLEIEL